MKVVSNFESIGFAKTNWVHPTQIKNEPMLFNCDLPFAWTSGGPITRHIISLLPPEWLFGPVVVDSRVHMLMKGWYPCIPGWHHDSIPRTRSDGQPNYQDVDAYKDIQHIACVMNSEVAPTQFIDGELELPDVPIGGKYYKEWHKHIESLENKPLIHSVKDGELIQFNALTLHQGVPATKDGWRFFIRFSRNDVARNKTITNEIRRQVQVYLEQPMEGW